MHRISLFLLATATLFACTGGEDGKPVDAREEDDAAVDAGVDAPDAATPSELALDPGFNDFGGVMMTRTSPPATFVVRNTGAGPTGAITVGLSGTHAGDFSASACNDLAP